LSSSPRRRIGLTAAIWIGGTLFALLLACRILPRLLPYAGQEALDRLQFSRVVLDADDGELQVLPLENGLRRMFVPLESAPAALPRLVITAEDKRFYYHPGFDLLALSRAIIQNRRSRSTVSGASTISMQVARLLVPRPRSLPAKIAEAWEAMQLESRLGKRKVLELYLSMIPFGRNAEGFRSAARLLYGRELSSLTPAELALLAVIPRAPGTYDPSRKVEPERRTANAAAAAKLLVKAGFAKDDASAEIAAAFSRIADPNRAKVWPFRCPQYLEWLKLQDDFRTADQRLAYRTAIEPKLQSYLESLLKTTVEDARAKRISNAACIFARPIGAGTELRIAAWVGSVDFFDESSSGQVDGVTMKRQPGSTLKPFLYSLALGNGFTAASVLPDIPTDFGGAEVYVPANFNNQFNGPIRLRQALASSLNVPAVYMLQRIGVQPFTDLLIANGFHSLEGQRGSLGLGLALGNAEISLFELVRGYGLFLNEGQTAELVPRASEAERRGTELEGSNEKGTELRASAVVKTKTGTELQARKPGTRLIDRRIALIIRDILIRHPDRTLVFGRTSNTRMSFEGAIKTGTSNQFNNIWAVGFTSDLIGGVWMGNFSGSTVVGTADSGYPASIISKTLEAFSAHEPFPAMEGLVRREVCPLSGMLAGELCPHKIEEWFLPGNIPSTCDWHFRAANGNVSVRYPQEYAAWIARYRYKGPSLSDLAELRISRPLNGSLFYLDPSKTLTEQSIATEATGTGIGKLLLDGSLLTRAAFPIRTRIAPSKGIHRLVLSDDSGSSEDAIDFEVR
jgi:penicillin-binding protein 1C